LRAPPIALPYRPRPRRPVALGPRRGETVVGLSTEEHGVGRVEGCRDGSTHLVIEVRKVPVLQVGDDAVEASAPLARATGGIRARVPLGRGRRPIRSAVSGV